MFSHPVSIVGYLSVVAGLFVTFIAATTRDSGLFLLVGYALVGIGPFLILMGVIAAGFEMMRLLLTFHPEIGKRAAEHEKELAAQAKAELAAQAKARAATMPPGMRKPGI